MPDLKSALRDAVAWLDNRGVDLPADLDATLVAVGVETKGKNLIARDRREPGRKRKEKMDARLAEAIKKHFDLMRDQVIQRLSLRYPGRKGLYNLDDMLTADFEDDEFTAEVLRIILEGGVDGITLFGEQISVTFDSTLVNARVLKWAQEYAGDLVKNIDNSTLAFLKQAVSTFVEMPGFTIGDIVDMLPLSDLRAWRIAVTETTRAYAQGQQLGAAQLTEEFPGVKIIKRWFTNNDDRVCDLCAPLDGTEVEQGEDFYEAEGEYANGNPPRHVNCILPDNKVIYPDLIAVAKSFYDGGCIEFTLSNGGRLTVTENHPILTISGWIAAKLVRPFDYVLCTFDGQRIVSTINPYNQNMPTRIQEIWGSLKESNLVASRCMPVSAEDFHGDGRNIYGNIEVVSPNGPLLSDRQSGATQPISQECFDYNNFRSSQLSGNGSLFQFRFKNLPIFRNEMGRGNLCSALFDRHRSPFKSFALGLVTRRNSGFKQTLSESPTIDANLAREFVLRFSSYITSEQIVKVRNFNFSGHVYDLQSNIYQLYITNGVIVKNCRCWTDYTTRVES